MSAIDAVDGEGVQGALWTRSALLFGPEERRRLGDAVLGVAGLGGVGCIVVEMLARLGIGTLRLADPDVFEASNLNRQLFATMTTLGANKAEVGAARVRDLNPRCRVETYPGGVNRENVLEFAHGTSLVYAQTDTMSSQVLLDRAGRELGVPIIKGARARCPGPRWEVKTHLWDYRAAPYPASREEENRLFSQDLAWDEVTDGVLTRIDREFDERMRQGLGSEIERGNAALFGPGCSPELLRENAHRPEAVGAAMCAPIANMAGLLAAVEGMKLILGWENDLSPFDMLRSRDSLRDG